MFDFLGCTVFLPGASKVSQIAKNGKHLLTLDPPGRKTVHPSKSNIEIKVVQNNISDNFYLDLNIIQPKLKRMNFYLKKNNGKKVFLACKKYSHKKKWSDRLYH